MPALCASVTSKMEGTLDIEQWDQERSGWKCKSGSHGMKTLTREHEGSGKQKGLQQHPEDC